ncbi:hypothetical protein [Robertkochia flava]|uniref:hypothetical protein n=1 Tax=Robertkochia flava TaxID=3447986 RepID=UPI001CCE0C94|nr:hypothetical protein [Robertkochia marina]
MKHAIRFMSLIGVLMLTGCNSSDAYKEQLDTLNNNWSSTTEELTSFAQSADTELKAWKDMYEGMDAEIDVTAISDDKKQILDSLDAVCRGHGDTYTLMNQEISELETLWTENAKIVEDLNDKFENNSLSEEHLDAIDQLNRQTEEVSEKLSTWKSTLENVKSDCAVTCQEYAKVIDQE